MTKVFCNIKENKNPEHSDLRWSAYIHIPTLGRDIEVHARTYAEVVANAKETAKWIVESSNKLQPNYEWDL